MLPTSFRVLIASTLLFAIGCGFNSEQPVPLIDKSDSSKNPLPPEYRVLCEHVAIDMKGSPSEFENDKAIPEIIAEGHSSIMALRGIHSDDTDITYVTSQAQAAYTEAVSHLERLNSMPKPQGAGSLFVESFIHGLYGNVYHGYAIGADAEEKQKAIIAELQVMMAAVDKADAAHMTLPTIAKKYAAKSIQNDRRIVIDRLFAK